jgi:predicted regulator of Ras-like GTPase activity (Roadblock/LC7/MglB family)
MKEVMRDLISPTGVLGCFVIDKEGEIVDYLCKKSINETLVSALIAEVTNEIANQMQITAEFSIFSMAENGNIFMIAREEFILTVITAPGVDTGKVRLKLRRGARLIAELL